MEESKQHVLFIKKSFDFFYFSLKKTNVKKNYEKISSLKGFSLSSEAVSRMCSVKKMLLKISQNS